MRLGNHMTGITPKSAAIATLLAVALGASIRAHADATGIVVVTGKIAMRERKIIETAIATTVRKASWSLSKQPFAPHEVDAIMKCLRDDKPWTCLRPLMQPMGVDRIVVADANPQPDSASKLVITGEFVVAGDAAAAVVQRRCDGCDDAALTAAAARLTEELLRDMALRSETVLELRTVPRGAAVVLDGQSIGTTDATGKLTHTTIPGPHKLAVHHKGFASDERTVDLPAAKTTAVSVELQRDTEPHDRSPVVPLALAGGGLAALVGGSVLIYVGRQDGPDDRHRYTRATPIGIGTGLVGVAAIGLGAYLWRRGPTESGVALSATPGGLFAGWAGRF
jgi:hypothetical protein